MKTDSKIDAKKLFTQILGEKAAEFELPPPSFDIMQCEIIAFDATKKSLTIKIPLSKTWLNPYGTMQGGFIVAAIDNAVGPLSMLIAPLNMTRGIETKFIKAIPMEVEHIYITATLLEQKKKRLIFDVVVEDKSHKSYTKAVVTNWIVARE